MRVSLRTCEDGDERQRTATEFPFYYPLRFTTRSRFKQASVSR